MQFSTHFIFPGFKCSPFNFVLTFNFCSFDTDAMFRNYWKQSTASSFRVLKFLEVKEIKDSELNVIANSLRS